MKSRQLGLDLAGDAKRGGWRRYLLPYPPSVNDYWGETISIRRKKGAPVRLPISARVWGEVRKCLVVSKYLNKKAMKFREQVAVRLMRAERGARRPPMTGGLFLFVRAHQPVLVRQRDTDNLLKALQDALEHSAVILNDSQFDGVCIMWGNPTTRHREGCAHAWIGPSSAVSVTLPEVEDDDAS